MSEASSCVRQLRPLLTRRLGAVITAAMTAILTVLALAVLPPGPAAAAAHVHVSVDGTQWAPQLPRPLFDEIDRIAPGDRQTDSVWLKNVTDSPLAVRVQMRWGGPADPTALDELLTVEMNGEKETVAQMQSQPLTVSLGTIEPGAISRVDTAAKLPLTAGNPTQRKYLEIDLVVQLSAVDEPSASPSPEPSPTPSDEPSNDSSAEPTPGPTGQPSPSASPTDRTTPPHGDDDDGPFSPLPRTGTQIFILAVIGLVIMTAGITAVAATRRRRNGDDGDPDQPPAV